MMDLFQSISKLDERIKSRYDIVMLRRDALANEGIGFAAHFFHLLQTTLNEWNQSWNNTTMKHHQSDDEEEKKQDNVVLNEYSKKSHLRETKELKKLLLIYIRINQWDFTLSQELAYQGCHGLLLRKLLSVNLDDDNNVDDYDTLVELQDLAAQAMIVVGNQSNSSNKNTGPWLIRSPLSHQELHNRLPLEFKSHLFTSTTKQQQDLKVLIGQVTTRQSAQHDVGFVMWPSAVVLAQHVVQTIWNDFNNNNDSKTFPFLFSSSSSNNNQQTRRPVVLELGAGCGLVGLLMGQLLSRLQQQHDNDSSSSFPNKCLLASPQLYLSDYNSIVIENLQQNILLNNLEHVARSIFFDFDCPSLENWQQQVDLVLAADVICQPRDALALAKTLSNVLKPDGDGKALVMCANAQHRFGVDCFQDACHQQQLIVQQKEISIPNNNNDDDDDDCCHSMQLNRALQQTTGYVSGMKLTLFEIYKK